MAHADMVFILHILVPTGERPHEGPPHTQKLNHYSTVVTARCIGRESNPGLAETVL
jgi:hypothetical protein